jgi:hypothetical protein
VRIGLPCDQMREGHITPKGVRLNTQRPFYKHITPLEWSTPNSRGLHQQAQYSATLELVPE